MKASDISKLLKKTDWTDCQNRVYQEVSEKAEGYRLARAKSYGAMKGEVCFD